MRNESAKLLHVTTLLPPSCFDAGAYTLGNKICAAAICVSIALEKQGHAELDERADVMSEVTHGGQGENGVTAAEDEGERERQRDRATSSSGAYCSVG